MGELGGELKYIADLITGTGPDATSQQGRGAWRLRRIPTESRGGGNQHAPDFQGPRNTRGGGSVNRHASTSTLHAPSSSHAEAEEDKYNKPSDLSTSKVLHCPTCDVWVPSRPGDWEVHIAGIRHRRHVLSLREHGERGRLVLSAFENVPIAGEIPSHRISGKASGAEFGLDRHGGGASGSGRGSGFFQKQRGKKGTQQEEDPEFAELRAMHTEAMIRCLGLYGSGHIYNGVDKVFNIEALRKAKAEIDELFQPSTYPSWSLFPLIEDMVEKIKTRLRNPAALLYLAHKLRQEASEQKQKRCSGPAAASTVPAGAVLATVSRYRGVKPLSEHSSSFPPLLILGLNTFMYNREEESAGLAAWLCSLQSFIHALAENPDEVEHLVITVPCDIDPHLQETIHKGWDRIIIDLENTLLAKNAKLKELGIFFLADAFLPGEQFYDDDYQPAVLDPYMYENLEENLAKFQKTAEEMADSQRLAILMSQHHRLGRCSLLQLLPIPVVAQIIELAVPKKGCEVSGGTLGQLPRFDITYSPPDWTIMTTYDFEGEERNSEEGSDLGY